MQLLGCLFEVGVSTLLTGNRWLTQAGHGGSLRKRLLKRIWAGLRKSRDHAVPGAIWDNKPPHAGPEKQGGRKHGTPRQFFIAPHRRTRSPTAANTMVFAQPFPPPLLLKYTPVWTINGWTTWASDVVVLLEELPKKWGYAKKTECQLGAGKATQHTV